MDPVWRKSSLSGSGAQSDCVELALLNDGIGIRDSKNAAGPHLTLSAEAFGRLVRTLKEQ